MVDPKKARELWELFEPLHVVTYHAPECLEPWSRIGLSDASMGYFAGRAAPLGSLAPGAVAAALFLFHPAMVARAIPEAWRRCSPEVVLTTRRQGAAAALRRLAPGVQKEAEVLVEPLSRLVAAAPGAGRVLFSANRDLGISENLVEALWQLVTCLREHRADGHIATLCGLSPPQALLLFARFETLDEQLQRERHGWATPDWDEASSTLEAAGLLEGTTLSEAGRSLCRSIERTTDGLAVSMFASASSAELELMATCFAALAGQIKRNTSL